MANGWPKHTKQDQRSCCRTFDDLSCRRGLRPSSAPPAFVLVSPAIPLVRFPAYVTEANLRFALTRGRGGRAGDEIYSEFGESRFETDDQALFTHPNAGEAESD